jgi:hypothetical protein
VSRAAASSSAATGAVPRGGVGVGGSAPPAPPLQPTWQLCATKARGQCLCSGCLCATGAHPAAHHCDAPAAPVRCA